MQKKIKRSYFTTNIILKLSKQYAIDFDQLISILPPRKTDMDFSAEIFNADGSKAKNCN